MKKIHIFILLVSLNAFGKEDFNQINSQNLKKYGMAYCLNKYHQKTPSPDIGLAMASYFEGSRLADDAFFELADYIDGVIPKIPFYAHSDGTPLYFVSCMKIYESSQYAQEVTRIIKKYPYEI